MTAIRDYLVEKAALPPSEWLRRAPRETHPEIVAATRDAEASGLTYDDDVERYVNERAGDLPQHRRHAHPDRNPIVAQLGHEVYIARLMLDDERATAALTAALDEGYAPLSNDDHLVAGARYLIRLGTVYSGRSVPTYGRPTEVRVVLDGARPVLVPKGARTRGISPSGSILVKAR